MISVLSRPAKRLCIIAIFAGFSLHSGPAQPAKLSATGLWSGILVVGSAKLRLQFHLDPQLVRVLSIVSTKVPKALVVLT